VLTLYVEGYDPVAGIAPGERMLDVCERAGLPVEAACGGFAACNTCRVRLIDGLLSAVEEAEEPFLDEPGQRLACQAMILGDVHVRLDPGP